MHIIRAEGVNDAYQKGLYAMRDLGVVENSRNGKVRRIPVPVVTQYARPWERVLFDQTRDANPFFHLFEALWMLDGNCDVATPARFAKQIMQYSDDGLALDGAYGYRWRHQWQHDQIEFVIGELEKNPHSRRAVISMWDPNEDIDNTQSDGKDIPCNTTIYFSVDHSTGALDMTVCCRSNDMIWGAYGANVVHMTYLQEYVALALGRPMGYYYQLSNNFHMYEKHFPLLPPAGERPRFDTSSYTFLPRRVTLFPKIGRREEFDLDNKAWNNLMFDGEMEIPVRDFGAPFFHQVAIPMFTAWAAHKDGSTKEAIRNLSFVQDDAWKKAAEEWLKRRLNK